MHESEASIVHINITDFAAAVAIAKQPRLANRPFAIALEGSARRVVITASRKAWEEGIRAGMPVSTAQRMLPDSGSTASRHPIGGKGGQRHCLPGGILLA